MARFLDGPVADVALDLRRCPMFLRVVVDETDGRVDALDQLDDTPSLNERVYVYRSVPGSQGAVFLCRGGGRFEYADYRYVGFVEDERVRETARWRAWCTERAEAEGLEIPAWPPVGRAAA